jgi:hypothetical protein
LLKLLVAVKKGIILRPEHGESRIGARGSQIGVSHD